VQNLIDTHCFVIASAAKQSGLFVQDCKPGHDEMKELAIEG